MWRDFCWVLITGWNQVRMLVASTKSKMEFVRLSLGVCLCVCVCVCVYVCVWRLTGPLSRCRTVFHGCSSTSLSTTGIVLYLFLHSIQSGVVPGVHQTFAVVFLHANCPHSIISDFSLLIELVQCCCLQRLGVPYNSLQYVQAESTPLSHFMNTSELIWEDAALLISAVSQCVCNERWQAVSVLMPLVGDTKELACIVMVCH